ncbi:L-dopachrome tautomerase-related protein [Pseudazoarcus pumilus]|uniref:Gluconolaconase n=1 Tax=Pseudazoarcus pumilus TaxID=2067960 RepID=A0A2I6S398_9RHOO|nr:L-dopachrome tautomerase-related protein [Pseudazoarcus pumilus]AUN93741.1 hypothetical protein C0099_01585 [Pseudazoarcus pumilus]
MTPAPFARIVAALALSLCATLTLAAPPTVGRLEIVAELPFRPGNVAVSDDRRIFATVHPFDPQPGIQLVEVTGRSGYRAWPGKHVQGGPDERGNLHMDTPLGIHIDGANRLWVTDTGMNVGETRLWAFDLRSGRLLKRLSLPQDIAPAGSFVQDLVVDAEAGWAYLADIAAPALIAVRIDDGYAYRFVGHPSLAPEDGAQMRVDGRPTMFNGEPARVGVNPISLSADGETLYFGAMTGLRWYAVPTRLLREGSADEITAAVRIVGRKPVSDGATTDAAGNHYFTNLNENGIDQLGNDGILRPLVRDARLEWPDSVSFGERGWLYIVANQLHRSPPFTGGRDAGIPPYRIFRMWTESAGVVRR